MKNSTLKKALSLMLVAVLTLSLSGITVFAENAAEDESAAIITELPAETPGGVQAPETPEASEDPSAPPAAEPTVEPTAEPEQPLPTELPQISLSEYAINGKASDGAVITISGLLPVGAYVTAEPVAVTLGGGIVLAAYDIKIFDGEGSEWQPGESVSVSIDSPAIANADKVTIYHMEDTGAPAEEVATVNVAGTEVAFEAESFSIYAVVSSNDFRDRYPAGVKAKVYLYYNNAIPTTINQPFAAGQFGPKGDDTPYFEVTVNVAQLLADPKITVEWTNNNTRWYISAQSPGAGYTSAELWSKILACMSAEDQAKFSAIGAGTYMGYVLKDEGIPHIDGILTVSLPYYRSELYIDGQFAKYLAAANDTTHKETEIKNEFLALLRAKYSDNSLTINWANQTFTSNGKIYHLKLNGPSHGTTGVGFENNGKQKYEKQNGVNFYLACQYIDIIADQGGTSVPGSITISGTKTWNDSNDAAHARPATLGLILKKNGAATGAVPVWTQSGNTWTYTFTVPYDESRPAYTVEEVAPANYSGSASSAANTGYNTQLSAITRVTNGDDKLYGPYAANFIIAKQTANEGYVIWTARQISPTEQAQLLAVADKIEGMSPSPTNSNTVFVVGNGAKNYNPDKGYTTFKYVGDKVSIVFDESKVWSQFAYGAMTTTYTPENGSFTNTYVPPVYTVTYKAGAGSGADVDGGSRAAGISYPVLSVLPGGFIAPVNHHFTGWVLEAGSASAATSGSATQPAGNVVYVAQYAADPTYGVTYEYVAASGSLPAAISTTAGAYAVSDTDTYYVGQTVHNKYSGSTTYTVSTGVWTLISWSFTPTDAVMTSGGVKFTGTWAFTQNGDSTVTVHYVDTKGNTIADPKTVTGTIGSNYDVSGTEYVPTELVNAGIYYDYSSDKAGSALYTGAYAAAAAIITRVYAERTYFAPHGTKIVSGLSTLPTDYRVTLELRGPNGTAIATAILKAEDFEKQENGTFTASFGFGAPAGEGPVTFAPESLSLPAGTYAVVETSISSVSGMNLAAPAYSLTIFDGEETPAPTATNQIPIGVNGENPEYRFTVTNAYSAIYYPPVDPTPDPTPGPTPTPPVEIPEEETPLTPTPPVEIPEEEVPLNPAPEEESAVEIVEEETPLAPAPAADKTIPQTGDNSATALFAILAVLSATGLAVLGFGGKKKERDSN